MAVTTTSTDTQAILKVLYPQKRLFNLVYDDHALLAMLPKDETFTGKSMDLAIRFADTQGRAVSFSNAQARATQFQARAFTLRRVKDYQVISLETEAILAARGDKGALIPTLETETDSAVNNLGKSLGVSLFRGQSGYLGQVSATVDPSGGTTVTLANPNDITSFEVGMLVCFSATKTGANRAGGNTTISAVDRGAGTFTVSANVHADVAVSDYIFQAGDNGDGSGGAGNGQKILGLEDWLPATAPTAGDSFQGVDRSVDATRLGGLRIDIRDMNPEEGYVTVFSRQSREGGKPSHLFLNHRDYRDIGVSLGSKVVYEDLKVGDIGFQTIKINAPRGPVSVIADQDCPQGRGFSLDMRTWKLYSLGSVPRWLDMDGARLSREASADRWEARLVYFAQLGCHAPGYNATIQLTTATDQ